MAVPDHEQSPERVRNSRRTTRSHDPHGEEVSSDQVDSTAKAGIHNGGGPGSSTEPIVQTSQSPPSISTEADLPSTVAIAVTDSRIGTRAFLSFSKGDRIVDIVRDRTLLKGTLDGTENRGFFHPGSVEFVLNESPSKDEPGTSQQHKLLESSPVKRASSTRITSTPAKSPTPSNRRVGFIGFISKSDPNGYAFAGCVVLILAVLAYYLNPLSKLRWGKPPAINVTEIMGQFKSQDPEMWDMLRAGLLPSKREEVQTFLFLHNNKPTTECLIDKLADNYCAVYKAGDLSFDESFTLRMKDDLQNQQCVVIYDLENLNSDGIKVLKGFCDAYTPIVRNAKFFFALNAGGQQLSHRSARQILESKWSEWSTYDDFGGTVTRLTQNVLTVSKEDPVPC